MRQIKFRGFQNSWIYGGISIFNGEATIYDENCVANSAYEVDIASVGEFTGLIDKNGNEIYEGDIESYGCEVKFWNGSFVLENKSESWCYLSHTKDIEIIGNVFENPELLK